MIPEYGEQKEERSVLRNLLVLPIRAYRWFLSPLLPSCCRFTPSCSLYAIEAIERHGIAKGVALSFTRLLRCHPLCGGGFDPVPPGRKRR